jgi:hypothetical protein
MIYDLRPTIYALDLGSKAAEDCRNPRRWRVETNPSPAGFGVRQFSAAFVK